LHQNFGATKPYQVCHTDVSQVRLANQTWAYLSVMTDEASKEVLACQVSLHPNSDLITRTVDELIRNLPDHACPLIHSDQGWQYQLPYYTQRLANHHFVQSMSRKGHCLDNAPVESFFHILKTELLDGLPLFEDITAFQMMVQDYIHFFNYERVSLKTKGMTP
ncbi:IS3 family transposase, partial [Ligilactobacillus ruminis]